ncbi:carbohydrate ABC transporter permease [Sphaerochaeta halotolerans]|jgi:alpha-1,4-digalacturonate transport system permease protein|uniref:Sugar ABC transporter permease n=1 Tax=Sphaerochaeta halotolerans TaxID=2293840 RepID=A0A372MFL7_9SPIR|nr:sugar ABC transporter permease [Sphaerochaeta halotolerans]MBG0767436.1 sugar ABC transporter permease [Spirochaetaceae bacterium]MDN5334683.1 alpha,4-digalacturonate transport system permease protein [Sphaerochaeta sp.]MXI87561.1 ABC transporter permease subunit [Sphaerochaeta halotolerans]RFU94096.1 sugar ABC transporter permease [Sphaerochaeta halotolerans]
MKQHTKGNFHQTAAPLLFLLPNILIFGLFIIVPAIQGLRMSFTEWGVFTTPRFIGFANFVELAQDTVFWKTFSNTIVYSLFTVSLIMVYALALALLLYKNTIKGEKIFRSLFYIPSLLSMITVGIAWRFILGDEMGIINYLLRQSGGSGIPWLTDGNLAMVSIIGVSIWAQAGYYMIILIAGLQAIPLELYEAATIDGASTTKTFTAITLPLLRSTLLVVMVLSTIASFKAYELISVMTKGGPGYATKLIVQQVYQVAFLEDRMGYASAMSIVLMLIISIFTLVQFKFTGKEQDYE